MKSKSGYVLVLSLLVAAALVFFGIIYLQLFRSEQGIAKKQKFLVQAQEAAKAGLEDAMAQLRQDRTWAAGFAQVALPHSKASYSMSFNPGQSALPFSTNNTGGSTAVTGYGGRIVPSGAAYLISRGEYAGTTSLAQAIVSMGSSLFTKAAFLAENIKLGGNATIDSYNSSQGTYSQTHQNTGGDIGTNFGPTGSVQLSGSATVHGTITLGPDSQTGAIAVSGSSSYLTPYLTAGSATSFVYPAAPSLPAMGAVTLTNNQTQTLTPGSYSSINLSGNSTLTLQPGTYVVTGAIEVSGNASLVIPNGAVTLYAQGSSLSFSGNGLNSTQNPQNLLIYGSTNLQQVNITGNGTLSAALYAPNAVLNFPGNASFFGGVVAKSLDMSGSGAIHFDTSLKHFVTQGSGITVISRW